MRPHTLGADNVIVQTRAAWLTQQPHPTNHKHPAMCMHTTPSFTVITAVITAAGLQSPTCCTRAAQAVRLLSREIFLPLKSHVLCMTAEKGNAHTSMPCILCTVNSINEQNTAAGWAALHAAQPPCSAMRSPIDVQALQCSSDHYSGYCCCCCCCCCSCCCCSCRSSCSNASSDAAASCCLDAFLPAAACWAGSPCCCMYCM